MKRLIEKYRHDNLSPEELELLLHELSKMSATEVEAALESDWNNFFSEEIADDPDKKQHVLESIHNIMTQKRSARRRSLLMMAAASVTTLIIVGVAILIYNGFDKNMQKPMSVTTAVEEMASVGLPDGSLIKLNSASQLTYSVRDFDSGNRDITFSGEAYFNISHDKRHPFIIHTPNLEVKVVGTEFNFTTDAGDDLSVLYLVAGGVEMHSGITGDKIMVKPGEKAVFSNTTGTFSITRPDENENLTAWYSGEIRFESEPLDKVIQFLEKHYGCRLEKIQVPDSISGKDLSHLRFSGTLPTGNLSLALRAIEEVYSIRLSPAP